MIAVVRLYHGHIAALTAAVKAPVAKGVHHLTGIYILVQAAVFGVVVRRIVLRQLGKGVLGLLAAVILGQNLLGLFLGVIPLLGGRLSGGSVFTIRLRLNENMAYINGLGLRQGHRAQNIHHRGAVLLYITGLAVLAVQPVQAGILGAVLAVRSGNGHLLVLQGGLGHIQLGGVTGSLIGFLVEIGGGISAAQSSEVGAVALQRLGKGLGIILGVALKSTNAYAHQVVPIFFEILIIIVLGVGLAGLFLRQVIFIILGNVGDLGLLAESLFRYAAAHGLYKICA